jgi:hypothetical protein
MVDPLGCSGENRGQVFLLSHKGFRRTVHLNACILEIM